MDRNELVGHLRAHAKLIANAARDRATQRDGIIYNSQTHPLLLAEELQVHDMQTGNTRRTAIDAARGLVAKFKDENVLKFAPDLRPSSAASASWIGALCSQAVAYSPAVLGKMISGAAARNDTALVAALMPLLESKASYSKPFLNAPETAVALEAARQCLDAVPEVVASKEAADFADICGIEITALDMVCSNVDAGEGLAQHVAFNALPTIMPSIA
jgi:hypothetical protein